MNSWPLGLSTSLSGGKYQTCSEAKAANSLGHGCDVNNLDHQICRCEKKPLPTTLTLTTITTTITTVYVPQWIKVRDGGYCGSSIVSAGEQFKTVEECGKAVRDQYPTSKGMVWAKDWRWARGHCFATDMELDVYPYMDVPCTTGSPKEPDNGYLANGLYDMYYLALTSSR